MSASAPSSAGSRGAGWRHVIVAQAAGRFCGWPANLGIWSWGYEIVVGYFIGTYRFKADEHSIDRGQPMVAALARSLDGGETWTNQEHPELNAGPARVLSAGLDFTHPDFALRCWQNQFWASRDRGRSWQGPFDLGNFGMANKLKGRTDYLVSGRSEALLFLAAEVEGVQAGRYKDHAFCARTSDGGRSFEFVSWINREPPAVRGVMPATVRVSDTELVSVLRRRYDVGPGESHCWLDAFGSADNGCSWTFLSRVAYTDLGRRNGNPASLVRWENGTLAVSYGFRAPAFGMRAKISRDNGRGWGPEIILRGDALNWDFGYPRSVLRPDGKVVTVYYYTTPSRPEQHIAATIWDPS